MKLTLLCVGRIKRGPERDLLNDYLDRARKTGNSLGFRAIDEIELDVRGGADEEGKRLLEKLPTDARVLRLDERGPQMRSEEFAKVLTMTRDNGRDLCFIIGGAAGYSENVISAVPDEISFGAFTWPHRLVRVMLAEQIYRAVSIAAGTPYHKD